MTTPSKSTGQPTSDGPLFEAQQSVAVRQKGIGFVPVALVGAVVAVGLWGAWVTKEVLQGSGMPPIAKVQLQSMVGEYVQAQARSTTPPDQVTAETKAFMTEIQNNLVARGKRGQIVLVAEAVVSDNIPDITSELRKEVFAKVKMPQPAQLGQNDVMGAMRSAMAQPGGPGAVANGTAN